MKKNILSILAAVLLTVTLAGCSGGPAVTDPADITGETFGDGNISALVPDGWMGFHGTDYFEEYEEGYDPNVIQIAKGAKSEWDLLSTPYVMISYFGPDNPMFEPSKDYYDEGADLEPITLRRLYLEGLHGKKLRYSYRNALDRRIR